MRASRPRLLSAVRDLLAVVGALTTYSFTIVPRVRRELRAWEGLARTIPDPILRAHALATLSEKATNAEAAAVFAILAPRARRAEVVALMTSFQALTDYLDTISEQPATDPLGNSLRLHEALSDALRRAPPSTDYYLHHPQHDDGGYVEQLVASCRGRFHALPCAAAVLAVALRAASRCGEGQSYTHDAIHHGSDRLAAWAHGLERPVGYRWWELVAGASSSVAVHALFAFAAQPHATAEEGELIDAAYFPSIGALTVLLDNLVDRDQDAATGGHNYLTYYASNREAAGRVADITGEAVAHVRGLLHARRHLAIVAGVAGFYLSTPEVRTPYADPITAAILGRVGGTVRPILALMRLKQRVRGLRS